MSPSEQLDVLKSLATDIGYEFQTSTNPELLPFPSGKTISIPSEATVTWQLQHISRILTSDPELAMYEIDSRQESALRNGRAA
ncbi:MAG: hypothetical protein AAF456_17925 [Planctomycetota bacterium]